MIYGIDANALTRTHRTGTERYVFELLREMKELPLREDERVILYASGPIPDLDPLPENWELKLLPWNFPVKGWTHARLSLELARRAPHVFFSPAHEVPLATGKSKVVSTVHDVAFRRLADIYPSKGRARQEWAIRRAIKRSEKLIAVSQTTKDDLMQLYSVSDQKISVVHEAVRPELFSVDAHMGNYILSIGRVEKKKNIANLVEAFDLFKKKTGSDTKLKLAGSLGFGSEEILQKIEASPFKQDIELLGFVPDDQMIPLLCGARVYAFPSWYEGFGIPALEAMAAGVPLVASDISTLREVAGDAALFASPEDRSALARQLEAAVLDENMRSHLIQKGHERLKQFSWKKAAEETWEVLRNVAYGRAD